MTVHRTPVVPGVIFNAPYEVTFGFQAERQVLSVWYDSGRAHDTEYIVVGTGHTGPPGLWKIVATATMPDGFHVFHLLRRAA